MQPGVIQFHSHDLRFKLNNFIFDRGKTDKCVGDPFKKQLGKIQIKPRCTMRLVLLYFD